MPDPRHRPLPEQAQSIPLTAMPEKLVTCPACQTTGFTSSGLKRHRCKGVTRNTPALTETPKHRNTAAQAILPAADAKTSLMASNKGILSAARGTLEKHREIIIGHEEKFAALSLGPRLQMGLAALQAYQVFLIKDTAKRGQGRTKKNHVTRDMISPLGFEGWIDSECPWFKRVTAY